jgi:LysM repeat protein
MPAGRFLSGFFSGFLIFPAFLFFSCQPEKKAGPWVPEILLFAGDTIPIDEPEIRERLVRELIINQYWQASTVQWIRKSKRWFPLMDSLLKKNSIPTDLKYLVPIESGFDNVVSPKGASGFWQLMDATAGEFGLRINAEMDERLDPEMATIAASKLLQRGYRQFQSWPETAVSYNIGITGLKSVMNAQYSESLYDLLLNQESGRYLFRVLAAKLILENPERYGYDTSEAIASYQWKNQEVRDSIPDLPWWCRKNGFSYKCFRLLNPWIKSSSLHLPEEVSVLVVRIPLDCRQFTTTGLPPVPALDSQARQNRITDANLVAKKDVNGFGNAGKDSSGIIKQHLVRKGEIASSIARRYGLSLKALYDLNPDLSGSGQNLREGMNLRVSP